MSPVYDISGNPVFSLLIVIAHGRSLAIGGIAVTVDDGLPCLPEHVIHQAIMHPDIDDPVNLQPQKGLYSFINVLLESGQLVKAVVNLAHHLQIAENRIAVFLIRQPIDSVYDIWRMPDRDILDQYSDQPSSVFAKTSRQFIRPVPCLPDDILYFLPCLLTDMSGVVDDIGNCGG